VWKKPAGTWSAARSRPGAVVGDHVHFSPVILPSLSRLRSA